MTDEQDEQGEQEKKAKVLHTRVPESLESEIKSKAQSLGLSVSTLVRNILSNAFGLVEDIVVDSANVARSARGETPGPAGTRAVPHQPPAVEAANPILGWQAVLLDVNAVCDRCNDLLPKGSNAGIAVRERPGSRTILCEECLHERISSQKRPDRGDADEPSG